MSSTDTTNLNPNAVDTNLFSSLFGGGGGVSTSPFDFSGSVGGGGGAAASFFDPNSLFTSGGGFGSTDQYGQTAQEVQSTDPGNQLQGTYGAQNQQQQDTSQPAQNQPQQPQMQPGSLLAAVNARGYQGNPYVIGGGGAVPAQLQNPPLAALMRQGPVSAAQQPQNPIPGAQAALPPSFQGGQPALPPGVSGGGYNVIDAQAGQPAVAAAPAAVAAPTTGTPDPGDPATDPAQQAQQAAAQRGLPPQVQQIVGNFLRSPIGQLINQLTGGQLSQLLQQRGLGDLSQIQQQYANQVPRGYTAQNMPQWATPEQYAQYQRTGQMPSQTARGAPPERSVGMRVLPEPGRATATSTTPDVFQTGARGVQNVIGAPPGTRATGAGQGELTGTVDKSQLPKPSPDVQRAVAQAELGGSPKAPYPTNSIQGQVANVMATQGPGYTDSQGNRRQGMSPNAIAGVFMNVRDESGWNPNESHPDQPRYSGQANLSHGLYQEGGPDWPLFQQFLNGRDWRNPTLQTQFMMQHFAQRNPRAWNAMNNAPTSGQAAVIFLNNYLIPRPDLRRARAARYARSNQQVALQ